MRTYKCRACAFSFTEADMYWDAAINSGRCPKCSETLFDFPAPVKSPLLSMYPQSAMAAMTEKQRIMYFLLIGFAFPILGIPIVSLFLSGNVERIFMGLGGIVAENWFTAGFAFAAGWTLNDKTKRLAVSKSSYIALCATYFLVANILAMFMPSLLKQYAKDQQAVATLRGCYLALLTVIAYVFSWVAIKTNTQKPTADGKVL